MTRNRCRLLVPLAGLLLSLLCGTARADDAAEQPAPDLGALDLEQLTNLKVEKVYGVSKLYLERPDPIPGGFNDVIITSNKPEVPILVLVSLITCIIIIVFE